MGSASIDKSYASSRERYASVGVDTEKALADLGRIPLSLNCRLEAEGDSGTTEEPGNIRELREDLHAAFSAGCRAIEGEFMGSPENSPDRGPSLSLTKR